MRRLWGRAVFLFVTFPAWALLKYDPNLRFRTIKTENFYIHYHQGQERRAQSMAELAEKLHTHLTQRTNYKSFFRTHVVLSDIYDATNGFAGFVPWNRIEMFAAKPFPDSVLGYHGDWDELLFTHEYTHTLTLDQISGLPAIIRYTLGRVFFPNALQPAWIVEGSAVDEESYFGYGRNNSPVVDMIFRAEAEADDLKSINRASVPIRDWPAGHVHYLYGGKFLEWLRKKYPNKNPNDIHRENADNVLPFLNNSNSEDVFGKKFTVLWEEWLKEFYQEKQAELARIREQRLTPLIALGKPDFYQIYPRFADAKTLYFLRENNYERPTLRRIILDGKVPPNAEKIQELNSPHFLAIKNHAPYLLDLEYYRSFSVYSDIFDGKTGKQQTEKLRAFSLDYLPSGELLLVTQDAALFTLAIHSADGKRIETLLGPTERILANARIAPDGNAVVFTARAADSAANHLYLLSLKNRELVQLTTGNAIDLHPAFSSDGQKIVFSSNRTNGVFNLYEIDLRTRELSRLTHLTGGAFYPDYSPDGKWIALSEFAYGGYRIALFDRTQAVLEKTKLRFEKAVGFTAPEKKVPETPSKDYSVFPHIFPSAWLPEIAFDSSDNLTRAGFSISGNDVLWRDFYGINLLQNVEKKTTTLALAYENRHFYPDYFIAPRIEAGNGCGGVCSGGAAAGMRVPFIKFYTRHYLYLTGAYALDRTINKEEGRGSIGYAFSNTQYFSRSISPENGRSVGVSFTAEQLKNPGARESYLYSQLSYAEYLPGFFRNHVWLVYFSWTHSWQVAERILLWRAFTPRDGFGVFELRGYATSPEGQGLLVNQIEYRFPIWQPDWGFFRIPIFFRDFYGKIFWDVAQPYQRSNFAATLYSAGIELGHNNVFGFVLEWNAFIGYARGFGPGGEHQIYFGITGYSGVLWSKYSPHGELK
ncbi:MAG: DPP IV N-terminal domain-containing protein [Turneriella sp.]|nr:DPP IV N-terminal domain-containing protein [Turneriella sp.]